jgi:hypothetical protein
MANGEAIAICHLPFVTTTNAKSCECRLILPTQVSFTKWFRLNCILTRHGKWEALKYVNDKDIDIATIIYDSFIHPTGLATIPYIINAILMVLLEYNRLTILTMLVECGVKLDSAKFDLHHNLNKMWPKLDLAMIKYVVELPDIHLYSTFDTDTNVETINITNQRLMKCECPCLPMELSQ